MASPPDAGRRCGCGRLLGCYLAPGLLARPLARRDERYVETFLWLDIASLLLNLLADHSPRRALKRLPEERVRWRPLVNGTAWAFYHINRPAKDMLGAILPGALLASWAREFAGNICWTAAGHYLSNAFFSILAARRLREDPERGLSSAELWAADPP